MSKSATEPSITQRVLHFVTQRPSVRACLSKGYINYSALAREICKEANILQFDGVVMALRRLAARLRKNDNIRDKQIIALLKSSRSIVRNKIAVLILDKPREYEVLHQLQKRIRKERADCTFVEGEDAMIVIVNEDYLPDFRAAFGSRIRKATAGLALITILFDERLEVVSGVVALVYGLLAWNGINIVEEMSCWTDLMIVIEEKDLAAALGALSLNT